MSQTASNELADHLGRVALSYPGVETGPSCNNMAYKAAGKAFVFVGVRPDRCEVRLKLGASYAEAERLAAASPSVWEAGKFGWVKVTLPNGEGAPDGLLERWLEESYRLLAKKTLVRELDARS